MLSGAGDVRWNVVQLWPGPVVGWKGQERWVRIPFEGWGMQQRILALGAPWPGVVPQ